MMCVTVRLIISNPLQAAIQGGMYEV